MTVVASTQLTFDFEAGISERHKSLVECIRHCAYTHNKPLKTIAADMDLSLSDLSRKLSCNPDDPRRFSVDDLERFITATSNTEPVLYLIDKYLTDSNARLLAAYQQVAMLLPQLMELTNTIAAQEPK